MRKVLALMLTILLSSIYCLGQVSFFSKSSPSTTTDEDASPVVVDPTLEIITNYTIDGVRISITSNFTQGDILNFSEADLPSNVTGNYENLNGTLTFIGNASAAEYQKLLRTVTFTAFASGAKDRVIDFYLGAKHFYKANNHYYEYVTSSAISWTTARNNAAASSYFGLQGYLATITTRTENQFIQENLPGEGWIGASDNIDVVNTIKPGTYASGTQRWQAEGNFYWVTGPETEKGTQFSRGDHNPSPVNSRYINWNDKEPNDGGGEDFVQIKLNGGWNDMGEDGWKQVHGYIVEYGGLAGEPTLDFIHSRIIEVKPTILTTTASKNYHIKNSLVTVDPELVLKSGGMITNAQVTISGNFVSGDVLSFNSSKYPEKVSGIYNTATGVLSFTGTAKPSEWQDIFRNISFQSTSTSSNDRNISFSIGNIVRGSNGHFYEYVKDVSYTWNEAYTAAAIRTYMGFQGYLATITSQAENDLIDQKLRADGWLGGSDDYAVINAALGYTKYANQDLSEGEFYWVTGPEKGKLISTGNGSPKQSEEVPYMHWYNGEPNNSGGEHYLEIYSTRSGAPGEWNDLPNSNTIGMVVEYGGLDTDPIGVVLSATRVLTNDDDVLPVRGLDLQLKEKGNSVVLNWSVVGEEKVSHYDVLHSVNGSSFRKIAEVKAKDNSGQIVYSYTDQHAVNGTNYYKIVVVDEDGKLHYSDVRSIGIAGKLQLYPTVITDHFTVNQPNASPCLLTLTNALGVRLLQKTISQGINKIETGFLTGGTYFVQITRGSSEPEVFKIIKK